MEHAQQPQAPDGRAVPKGRVAAGIVSVACLGVLTLAASLRADRDGYGSHTQMGLPPCGWAEMLRKPCPTCGMTTAFAHAADGNLLASAAAQPAGMLLAVLTAAIAWAGGHQAATGARWDRIGTRLLKPAVLWTLFGILMAAWAYKWATWNPAL